MLKLAVAALFLSVSPMLPQSPIAAPPPQAQPANTPIDQPDLEGLKAMAQELAAGAVSSAEKQPMHVKSVLYGRRSDGKLGLMIFENADGSLVTALAADWKDGRWEALEVFRA